MKIILKAFLIALVLFISHGHGHGHKLAKREVQLFPVVIQEVYYQYEETYLLSDPYSDYITAVTISNLYVERQFHAFKMADNETLDDYCLCSTLKKHPTTTLPEFFLGIRVLYTVEGQDDHPQEQLPVENNLQDTSIAQPQGSITEEQPAEVDSADKVPIGNFLKSHYAAIGVICIYVFIVVAVVVHSVLSQHKEPTIQYAPLATPEIVVATEDTRGPPAPLIVYENYVL